MILTLKCDHASLLLSDSFDRKLAWYERIALRGHLFVCTVCPTLHRQMKHVHSLTRLRREKLEVMADGEVLAAESDIDPRSEPAKLSEQARLRMKERLRQANSANEEPPEMTQ